MTITPVNDAPVVSGIPDVAFNEDSSTTLDLTSFASDIDNAATEMTWTADVLTATGTLTKNDGSVVELTPADLNVTIDANRVATFSATADSNGVFTVKLTAADPGNLTGSDTITVTVSSVLDAPAVANAIPDLTFAEDSGPALAVADLNTVFTNPEPGTSLTFTFSSSNAGIQVSGQNDSLIIASSQDFAGSGQVIVTASNGATVSDTFTVTVTPVNDPPVLASISAFRTLEDTPLSVDLDTLVSDVDDALATLTWTVSFVNGTPPDVQIGFDAATNIVTFTPGNNFTVLNEPVAIEVCDPANTCDQDTVTFSVLPVNDPPVISNLPQSLAFRTDSSTTVNIWEAVSDVETADSLLTYSFISFNDSLLFNFNTGNGLLTLSASSGYNGATRMEVKVSDPENAFAVDTIDVTVSPVVGIDDLQTELLPKKFDVQQNYPNPFNPGTSIQIQLPKNSDVSLVIYNLLGQKVRSLVSRNLKAGYHTFYWDGLNDRGFSQASGVYIYRFTSDRGKFAKALKMILMK